MADPNGAIAGNGAGFKWAVVIALASAQFIMVLDSTVMNVSIQKVIDDLDTTVTKMQLAIATYTLTMAALMMIGGKIGDIIGRRRAFRIGLGLFGLGAGITAAAPNIDRADHGLVDHRGDGRGADDPGGRGADRAQLPGPRPGDRLRDYRRRDRRLGSGRPDHRRLGLDDLQLAGCLRRRGGDRGRAAAGLPFRARPGP